MWRQGRREGGGGRVNYLLCSTLTLNFQSAVTAKYRLGLRLLGEVRFTAVC